MKPTPEDVERWAREAQLGEGGGSVPGGPRHWVGLDDELQRFCGLAYAAGQADEREATKDSHGHR